MGPLGLAAGGTMINRIIKYYSYSGSSYDCTFGGC